jgi:hypothetical protein
MTYQPLLAEAATHRTYQLLKLPTMNLRLRVVSDWTLALVFPREAVSLMCSSTHARISRPRCASSPPGRTVRRHSRARKRKKMTIMLTNGEQQELRQIGQELRDTDRGFAWRLALLQDMLRLASPARRVYRPVLAVLAAALLPLAAAARRLLTAFAEGAVLMGSTTLVALGDTAWPGQGAGQAQVDGANLTRDQPQPGDTDQA